MLTFSFVLQGTKTRKICTTEISQIATAALLCSRHSMAISRSPTLFTASIYQLHTSTQKRLKG